jgi:predicted DNA-binding protein
MNTKLTVNVPQDLVRRAKARAALDGKKLTDIVRQSLEDYARGLDIMEEADDIRFIKEIEARLEAGEEQTHSHDEVWAEIARRVKVRFRIGYGLGSPGASSHASNYLKGRRLFGG